MLDDVDDVALRLRIIRMAQSVFDEQTDPAVAPYVAEVRGIVYDAAVAMRDGTGFFNYTSMDALRADYGGGAVMTWCLACSSLLGPLRPEILDSVAECVTQFAWPVQMPDARESRRSVSEGQLWRQATGERLALAVTWHRAWSTEGPLAAIAWYVLDAMPMVGDRDATRDHLDELALGLHWLTSWRLRVTAL